MHLRRDKFQAFVRLSEREQRPVEDVLAEWLADCAALIGRDALFEEAPVVTTAAQRWAAFYADERERSPYVDDQEAAREHAALGAGFVELTLAQEGC